MTDLLIRNVDDETLRRIDAAAERQGLSRSEYLRREVTRLAARNVRPVTRADVTESLGSFADLGNEAVMAQAWR